MTNDPSGNQLVINSVNNAGQWLFGRLAIALLLRRVCPLLGGVSFVKTMKTGGKGSRGNGGGPDALFSQDSVLVSHGNLFAVNVRRPTERVPCSTARALTLIMPFQTNNIVRLKYSLCVRIATEEPHPGETDWKADGHLRRGMAFCPIF